MPISPAHQSTDDPRVTLHIDDGKANVVTHALLDERRHAGDLLGVGQALGVDHAEPQFRGRRQILGDRGVPGKGERDHQDSGVHEVSADDRDITTPLAAPAWGATRNLGGG